MESVKLGKYLTLDVFCTCTQTYHRYRDLIAPFPENLAETIPALQDLNRFILDPIIDNFGLEKFNLTYGFCSKDLRKYLEQKNPLTGEKNGRVAPALDQHMAYERNKNGKYFCKRPGAACDFLILGETSDLLVEWILDRQLPFDSLYFYGSDRPIHISYGSQHKRSIWTFTEGKQPTQKGIKDWVDRAKLIQ
ncbi:MAG TPA: hypothetical protein IGS17_15380 [Oscillatoriales cyanobacterium M59_W2019_021]|nr:hypothetical protein [Oscillatoriales cyanobacterium M4454_W2019_049]HIK52289.1 hypothetical protein [Oscillatoriales cyanobacterium M59_W2019_021]